MHQYVHLVGYNTASRPTVCLCCAPNNLPYHPDPLQKFPPYIKCFTTLPYEIWMLTVASKLAVIIQSKVDQTNISKLWSLVIGWRCTLAMSPSPCPSLEKFLWAPMTETG